jgi:hypothetical protein
MKKAIIAMLFLVIGLAGYSQQVAKESTQDSIKYKMNQTMGKNGSYLVLTSANKSATTGGWWISAIEPTVVDSIKFNNAWLKSVTMIAGESLYGKIDSISLTSGKVIIYK